jgi:hypothetical protein
MKIPQGLVVKDSSKVCKLKKSLYDLKQASREWNHRLTSFLELLRYQQSKSDYSLFSKKAFGKLTFIPIYVDDLLLAGDDDAKIQQIKLHLDREFSIKDLGNAK